MEPQHTYWIQSRSPLYSFLFTLPLFLIYEISIVAISSQDIVSLRNGADVLMRQILGLFGLLGLYGFGIVFLIGFCATYLIQKKYWHVTSTKGNYLLGMFLESFGWGLALYLVMMTTQTLLMVPRGRLVIQQVSLAVGAGIYEEFLFRVILITGLSALLGFIFQWKSLSRRVGAIILAAVIFSWFHFIGEFGDVMNMSLFITRIIAGIFLGSLYSLRGFGITAYAHSIYDLIVLIQITTLD